ncbi:MAG: TerC family protein [Cyclobacteriaceae bacterium]|nr:TerC family protein [Cyclobacteriaceae bacterium]
MEILFQPESLIALLTLTFLEIVLGVDNIIFISIVSNKLPKEEGKKARLIGLALAMFFRIGLLMGITYITKFTEPLFSLIGHEVSARDLILLIGGLFLIFKSTLEVHHKMEGVPHEDKPSTKSSLTNVIFQIILLDIIFSFDSILTAVGLTDVVLLMIIAVIISMIIMMLFSGKISDFINKHPTLEVLALSFLILIGFMLIVESLHYHVPKGYIYFAVFFSLSVEIVNMRIVKKRDPLELRKKIKEE